MFKKWSEFSVLLFFSIFSIFISTASAIDLDEATRTVTADAAANLSAHMGT